MTKLTGSLRRMVVKSFRAVLILFVTATVIVIASLNIPVQQDASAKIFDAVTWHLRTIPEYFGQSQKAGDPVEVEINGQRMFYATSKSIHGTKDILDYYESLYKYDPQNFISQAFPDSSEARTEMEKVLQSKIDTGQMNNCLRLEAKRWAVFGVMDNIRGGWENAVSENFATFIEGAKTMMETGRISELGDPKVIIVFRDNPVSEATIFRTWLDDHFSLNAFKEDADGDLPGEDFADVPRYPGSKRVVSFRVPHYHSGDAVNVYRTTDQLLGAMLYYRTELTRLGWRTLDPIDKVMADKGDRKTTYFTKKGRECWISLRESGDYNYHTIITRGTGERLQ